MKLSHVMIVGSRQCGLRKTGVRLLRAGCATYVLNFSLALRCDILLELDIDEAVLFS